MYRKFYIFILIALALASCTKVETMRDVAVQFNADISPEMTVLVRGGEVQPESVIANHAVLQAWRGDVKAAEVVQEIPAGTIQISFSGVKLAGGAEYTIYIWVDCEGYYNTSDLRSVSVNNDKAYDGKTPQFDAYYSCSTVICGQDDEVHNVTLKRPFAKVSFRAAVTEDAHISYTAPNTLNLKTGKVSGSMNVGYNVEHGDSGVEAFDYVFADEGLSQMSYTFKLGEEKASTATVPIARNTKTNIIYAITN